MKDLKVIDAKIRGKIYKKIGQRIYSQLKQNPYYGSNIKKLSGLDFDTWRYRIGDYRLFYEIDDGNKIVFITCLEHRKNAY